MTRVTSSRCTRQVLRGPSHTVDCGRPIPCQDHDHPVSMADLDWKYMIRLPPPPTVLELLGRWGLTASEFRRVHDGHDPGDEDPSARRHGRWVCGRRPRTLAEALHVGDFVGCELDPNHWGPHDWETPPVPEPAPMFVYRRGMQDLTDLVSGGGHDPGDES